jgi:hypothetical protein
MATEQGRLALARIFFPAMLLIGESNRGSGEQTRTDSNSIHGRVREVKHSSRPVLPPGAQICEIDDSIDLVLRGAYALRQSDNTSSVCRWSRQTAPSF